MTNSNRDIDPLETDDPWLILERHPVLSRLENEQVLALIPLARGRRIAEVAAIVNRNASTIHRWVQVSEDFKAALKLTVGYIYQYGLRSCAIASEVAAKTLLEVTQNKDSKDSDRVRAATVLLEYGGRWQAENLEERLERLERLISEKQEVAGETIS